MSEHYEVLARKYRPHNFKELVGQSHTIRTLVNALENNHLHHGFLFTGTRGVGKTTIARIFAKSVNCETGVSSNPCGKCETCLEIDLGQSVDLIELDAASHTGVDNMREILENAQYTPTKNLYKIYLIDEVHMLSKSSFNALLKTLEEPPKHIKFLLATTDPKKLPITILSRCLQFNLNKLTHNEILEHLKFIMNSEKLEFEDKALSKIADFGNGSMRDALSLLDQSISYGNGSVKDKDITEMLGIVNHTDIAKLALLVIEKKAKEALLLIRDLAHRGENLSTALKDLTSLFHKISTAQMIVDEKQISPEIIDLANKISAQDVINNLSELELKLVIKIFGEEKEAGKIAKNIVKFRNKKKITKVKELVDIIEKSKKKNYASKINPSTKTFQALRIFVNKEITELINGIINATKILKPGGKILIVSFHSIEDKIVKYFFSNFSTNKSKPSRYLPEKDESLTALFDEYKKKVFKPTIKEITKNNRSRSAKLRYAIRSKNKFSYPYDLIDKFKNYLNLEAINV